jgi:hypothetical protein
MQWLLFVRGGAVGFVDMFIWERVGCDVEVRRDGNVDCGRDGRSSWRGLLGSCTRAGPCRMG